MGKSELKIQIACFVSANPGCSVSDVRHNVAPYSWQEQIYVHKLLKELIQDNKIANWGPKYRHKLYLVNEVLDFPLTRCPF